MNHWNCGGSWMVHEGGHGTEKAFRSAHMWCIKAQEVLLTDHFAEVYLDTAPEIQVYLTYSILLNYFLAKLTSKAI